MNEKFLAFIAPYLSYIDSGKIFREPFRWFYAVLGVLNLLFPLYILYRIISEGVFRYAGFKEVVVILLVWLVLLVAGWVSFQIWWNRKDKVLLTSVEGSDFPATPVISHFLQTTGEWLGTYIAGVGFFFTLFALIFLGDEAAYLGRTLGLPFGNVGIASLVLFPIYGFLILVLLRFLSELYRAVVTIAVNTKKENG